MNFEEVADWPTVAELQGEGVLLVEDGNHGEYRPRPDEFVDEGPALFIRAADMSDGRILFDEAKAINEVALARIRKGVGSSGDVIFSHKGTVGKVALAPDDSPPFVCSPQTTFWRTLDESELDRRFLHAYLRSPSFVHQWYGRKGETDMADYVSLTAQRRLRVPVIPIEAQRQIGAAVSQFDDLIENNRRRIEILEEMVRLLYREWFVHYRFPEHEDVELVDSELGPIPEGWTSTTLGDFAAYINRGIAPKYDEDSSSLVVNQRCVRNHKVNLELARTHSKKVPEEKYVGLGDVLVNSTGVGTLGRVAPLRDDCQDTTVDSHVTIVRPADGVDIDFFAELILSQEALFEAMGIGSTGQTELSRARVSEVPIAVPPAELQDRFGSTVKPGRELMVNLLRQTQVLSETRDLLLPRLVSGELDVSELGLEAAG